jgi:hypothetical protein
MLLLHVLQTRTNSVHYHFHQHTLPKPKIANTIVILQFLSGEIHEAESNIRDQATEIIGKR